MQERGRELSGRHQSEPRMKIYIIFPDTNFECCFTTFLAYSKVLRLKEKYYNDGEPHDSKDVYFKFVQIEERK